MPSPLVASPPRSARAARPRPADPLELDLARLHDGLLAEETAHPAPPRVALGPPAGARPRRDPSVWSDFFGLWI